MTKSEFELRIDKIMDRHEANIRSEFQSVRSEFKAVRSEMQSMESRFDRQFLKIDVRYNWIIGITVTSVIGIVGILFKIISMLPAIPQ